MLMTYGPELVTNGDFKDNGSGWSFAENSGWAWAHGGKLVWTEPNWSVSDAQADGAGAGYTANDVLTFPGATDGHNATIKVTGVDGDGAITTWEWLAKQGLYQAHLNNHQFLVTGGTGTGAGFDLQLDTVETKLYQTGTLSYDFFHLYYVNFTVSGSRGGGFSGVYLGNENLSGGYSEGLPSCPTVFQAALMRWTGGSHLLEFIPEPSAGGSITLHNASIREMFLSLPK